MARNTDRTSRSSCRSRCSNRCNRNHRRFRRCKYSRRSRTSCRNCSFRRYNRPSRNCNCRGRNCKFRRSRRSHNHRRCNLRRNRLGPSSRAPGPSRSCSSRAGSRRPVGVAIACGNRRGPPERRCWSPRATRPREPPARTTKRKSSATSIVPPTPARQSPTAWTGEAHGPRSREKCIGKAMSSWHVPTVHHFPSSTDARDTVESKLRDRDESAGC